VSARAPRFIGLDGERYLWRDRVQLRQEQRAASRQGEQPALIELHEDCPPGDRADGGGPLPRTVCPGPSMGISDRFGARPARPSRPRAGQWVTIMPTINYDHLRGLGRVYPEREPSTKVQQAGIDPLTAR